MNKGSVRFILLFEDKDCSLPVIQTLVYQRSELKDDGRNRYLFREVGSADGDNIFFVDEENFDQLVLDACGLADRLSDLCNEGK